MDLNGDGNRDLFAAGYSGLCYIFYGKEDGSLSEREVLKDKTGTYIHSGEYYNLKARKEISFDNIKNHDKLYFAKAFDWDNDGDLDLLLSGKGGVKLRINEGSKTMPLFASRNIDVLPKYHADAIVDWDGDGLWDIVCGSKKGSVYFYKNKGKLGKPKFRKAKCILKDSVLFNPDNGGATGLSQVTVADYNSDGKLDLIVGSNNLVYRTKENFTKDQIKEKVELLKKDEVLSLKIEKVREKYKNEYRDSYKEMYKALHRDKKYIRLKRKISINNDKVWKYRLPTRSHGYVFVSLRK